MRAKHDEAAKASERTFEVEEEGGWGPAVGIRIEPIPLVVGPFGSLISEEQKTGMGP